MTMDRSTGAATLILLLGLAAATQAGAPADAAAPRAEPGWLGVWLVDAVDGGAQIVAVWPGGPADRGGIRSGDVLLEAAGVAVLDQEDLGRVVSGHGAGDEIPILIVRGSQELRVPIRLGTKRAMPATPGAFGHGRVAPLAQPAPAPEADPVGIDVEAITPALSAYLGAPERSGVLVTRVVSGRLAAEAGLRVGDVIVRLGEEDVSSPAQVRGTLASWNPEPVPATVVRERRRVELQIRPPRGATALAHEESREALRRRIEAEIERLSRRIEELRRAAEELEGAD
jgi:S1-C subfamily serine protease